MKTFETLKTKNTIHLELTGGGIWIEATVTCKECGAVGKDCDHYPYSTIDECFDYAKEECGKKCTCKENN